MPSSVGQPELDARMMPGSYHATIHAAIVLPCAESTFLMGRGRSQERGIAFNLESATRMYRAPVVTFRSPEILQAQSSRLVIIDVQEKLAPTIPGLDRPLAACRFLIEGARLFQVPTFVTEQ